MPTSAAHPLFELHLLPFGSSKSRLTEGEAQDEHESLGDLTAT